MFSGPRRYCAIFLPLLSADRWLRESSPAMAGERPFAFIEKQRGTMRIVALGEQAAALGIAPGMALADARALVPDLQAIPHDPDADAALIERIAEDCDRYTPLVALDPPDGLILDITGCSHLWGSEADLLSDLAARLVHGGMTIRIAIAETPDKARALARHGGELIRAGRQRPPSAFHEERAGYMPPLPVAALDLDRRAETALKRAGLHTIDDLARRARTPLAARFGMAATAKLARVLGEEDVRIVPRRVPPALFVFRRFAEPLARTDDVLAVIGELGREAETALGERGQGARSFALGLFRSDGDVRRLRIETGAPTRDPALLIRLFRERIESLADPLDPGFGYDAIRLDIARTEPLTPAQCEFDSRQAQAGNADMLADRLSVRLGRERVRRLVPGNSHIPELAGFSAPYATPTLPFPALDTPEPGEPPMRPLRLFDPPQRIEVMAEIPDGPPVAFRWKRRTHRIRLSEGPERIASEWWRKKAGYEPGKAGLTRDYFRVEDADGRRFWLFRHGLYGAETPHPDWYLHGAFA